MTAVTCPQPTKVAYPGLGSALTARATLRKAHIGTDTWRAYRCVCGSFHLTTATERFHEETTT